MMVSRADLIKLVPLDRIHGSSLNSLLAKAGVMELKQGALLFERGDTSPFAYYLMSGRLELLSADGRVSVLEAGSRQALFAVGNLIPRQMRAVVGSPSSMVVRFERKLLEQECGEELLPKDADMALSEVDDLPDADRAWLLRLLRTPLFGDLPVSNIKRLFGSLEEVLVSADEVVLHEGAPAHHFFILRKGSARVVRACGEREIILNRLKELDSFGGEALITGKLRGATVIMDGDGILMRVNKDAFLDLIKTPLVKRVNLEQAARMIQGDRSRIIDVRGEDEFADGHLRDVRNIPLYMLYLKSRQFVRGHRYIVYCDTGERADAAAFLLAAKGFHVYVLEEGSKILQDEIEGEEVR